MLSGVTGAVIGVIAAQFRSLDAPIMRLMDALMSFPAILLALGITAALGPRMDSVIIALTVAYVPARRAHRARLGAGGARDGLRAGRAGSPARATLRIMLRHILPNSFGPLLVHLTFVFAYAILAEAALSFLGVGVPAADAELGQHHRRGPRLRHRGVVGHAVSRHRASASPRSASTCSATALRDVLDPRLKGGD